MGKKQTKVIMYHAYTGLEGKLSDPIKIIDRVEKNSVDPNKLLEKHKRIELKNI